VKFGHYPSQVKKAHCFRNLLIVDLLQRARDSDSCAFSPGMMDIVWNFRHEFHMPFSEPFKAWIGHLWNWCLIVTEDIYFVFLTVSRKSLRYRNPPVL
jgi:hypothetical protein